jgi:hypothetical protein
MIYQHLLGPTIHRGIRQSNTLAMVAMTRLLSGVCKHWEEKLTGVDHNQGMMFGA